MNIELIEKIVIENITMLVETLPENQKFVVQKNTILFGPNSQIDSLSLVTVVVDLETAFYDDYNIEISLTDDNAMTRDISPFDNVGNLIDYIFEIVNSKK